MKLKLIQSSLILMLFGAAASSYSAVIFQNSGTISGWGTPNQNPLPGDDKGTVSQVSSPTYNNDGAALKATQIYDPTYSANSGYTGGYHAEVVQYGIASLGKDLYFGQAIMLDPGWVYEQQGFDCFQQWAAESPSAPWTLMGTYGGNLMRINITGNGAIAVGGITRGVWTRIIVEFKFGNPGTCKCWVNGTLVANQSGLNVDPKSSPTIRWSSGIYCTAWRNHKPTDPDAGDLFAQTTRTIYHDQFRIADNQAEADPANWGSSGGFSGNYEIQSVASGQAVNVSGNSTANGAAVIQWGFQSGNNGQLWTFVPTSNGYYQVKNVNSGLDMVVQSASTSNGGKIIQWSFGSSGNDQWKPVKNSDGTYTFFNLHSGLVLDDPGSSTTQGTQYDQWTGNGGSNQKFNLISR